eukprot:maker-scaffold1517_size37798-snap-gene-0.10 protein:Tk07837 transcript:maker-scaffold1517_size37798-snap-gene-0.10-mRNA-1 annotation:"predicted protein"
MLKVWKSRWKSYKYRFLPWLALNLRQHIQKPTVNGDVLESNDTYYQNLLTLLMAFERPKVELAFRDTAQRKGHFDSLHEVNNEILRSHWGFQLAVRTSLNPRVQGKGVFVAKGSIRKGQMVALYPGTIYEPFQPILIQSIGNQYILRCIDGINIDGNNRGLSKIVYKSLYGRERWGWSPICDVSWLHRDYKPANPLSIGQIVNNGDVHTHARNVTYHEMDLNPELFDPGLRILLPNIHYESETLGGMPKPIRIVPLIATKDITQGEELYSSYFSAVSK